MTKCVHFLLITETYKQYAFNNLPAFQIKMSMLIYFSLKWQTEFLLCHYNLELLGPRAANYLSKPKCLAM